MEEQWHEKTKPGGWLSVDRKNNPENRTAEKTTLDV
jgi:hypothetical protein